MCRLRMLVVLTICCVLPSALNARSRRKSEPKAKPYPGKVTHREMGDWRDAYRGGMTISPDGRRCAYWRRAGIGESAVIDGKESDPTRGAVTRTFVFSDDSTHVAYAARTTGSRNAVFVDGKKGPELGTVLPQSMGFVPGTGTIVYVASKGPNYNVMVNHKPVATHFRVNNSKIVFSADGKHMAYLREIKPQQLYAGTSSVLVVDGKDRGKTYWLARGTSLAMSPDGKRVAFGAKTGDAYHGAVIDDKPEGKWSAVSDIVFSPDSTRYAYKAQDGSRYHVVVDGKRGPELRMQDKGAILFSPDSRHVAYTGVTDKGTTLFLDHKPLATPLVQGRYSTAGRGRMMFSADSGRLGVVVSAYRGSSVCLFDTKTGKQVGNLGHDTKPHTACLRDNGWTVLWADRKAVWVNDMLIGEYEQATGRMGFDPDGSPWCIISKDGKVVRVTAAPLRRK